MRSTQWLRALVPLLILTALVGCGGDDGGGSAPKKENAPEEKNAPRAGSNVPKGGKTVTASVLNEEQRGIPADVGQWMIDIGVGPGGDLAFTVAKARVPSGNANFRLKNPQAVGHDLVIEEVGAAGAVHTPVFSEGSRWTRVSLFESERYVFYCSVPGHREAGMEGTIEVDPRLDAKDLKAF